jgi:glycine cleavage system aminomethyltransferase T
LLAGPYSALAGGPPIGAGRERSDLPHKDIRATVAILSIIGPRASRLLAAAASLPSELAIGAVGRDPVDANVIVILRESQRRFLVLVRARGADALWTRLLTAGEPLGAAFVGLDALTLLSASSASSG